LTREHLARIVDIQLNYLRKRLADRKMQLQITDAAKRRLATDATTRSSAPDRSSD